MRLLLVEDDNMIGAAVRKGLQQDGYSVDWLSDGKSAEFAIAAAPYDLVLLDLGLPGRDGLSILANLRKSNNPVPVIIVTARDDISARVEGLDLGADDYLLKPFELLELAARIRAVTRRGIGQVQGLLTHGPLTLDPAIHEVLLHGKSVELSAREFAVLKALLERPNAVLSRAQLEDRLYGWDEEIASNAIEVHIHHLRKKLGQNSIKTIRGIGYSLAKLY